MKISPKQAEEFRSRFISLVGWERLESRDAKLRGAMTRASFLEFDHKHRFHPLLRLVEAEDRRRARGGAHRRRDLIRYYDVYSFTSSFMTLYDLTSDIGKKKLLVSVGQALRRGFAPLLHELQTYIWLRDLGYHVEVFDSKGGSDYLARRNNLEVEIECKVISADNGRRVTRQDFHNLAGVLLKHNGLLRVMGANPAACVVQIEGRLPKSSGAHQLLATACLRCLGGEPAGITPAGSQVSRLSPDFPDPRHGEHQLRHWIETQLGSHQFHCCVIGTDSRVLLLVVRSMQPDSLIVGIKTELEEARRLQLSGSRPSVLVFALEGIYGNELASLKKLSALSEMTHRFFLQSSRVDVRGVCYVAQGTVEQSEGGATGQLTVLKFMNPKPSPFAEDPLDLIA